MLWRRFNAWKTVCTLCDQRLATNVIVSGVVLSVLHGQIWGSSGQKHFGLSEACVRDNRGLLLADNCRCLNETGGAMQPGFWLLHLSSTVWLTRSFEAPTRPSDTLCLFVLSWKILNLEWHQGFFTLLTNGTMLDPLWIDAGSSLSREEVVTRRASVLSLFSCRLFWIIQPWLSLVQHQVLLIVLSMLQNLEKGWVVYHHKKSVGRLDVWQIKSDRGFVYIVNKAGPKTEPWGTQNNTGTGSESRPRTEQTASF